MTSKGASKPNKRPTKAKTEASSSGSETEPPEMAELARRYLDLWQEEAAAIAADPTETEAFGRWFASVGQQSLDPAGWIAAMRSMAATFTGAQPTAGPRHDGAGGPNAKAGATPAGAASGDGAGNVAELADRVAALERQVRELAERAPQKGNGRSRQPSRRSTK
ncbi:MAG: hypothetical protein AAF414_08630 [Pseudomonadota bacterium]